MKPQLSSKMVNGGGGVGMMVDDGAMALLREEIEKIKSSMVTRESYELLQRELKATKDALDSYKKDNNKKLSDFMNEVCMSTILLPLISAFSDVYWVYWVIKKNSCAGSR